MKSLVVVPSYNEGMNIVDLVKEIKNLEYDYIVLNDNSTDNTEVISKKNDINIINMCFNVGLGEITRQGYMYAVDNNYDYIVCVDGDGQHQPKYIKSFIEELEKGVDYVVGSRFINFEKPFSMRMIGSRLLAFFIKIKTLKKITDPTSGMRAMNIETAKYLIDRIDCYAEPDTICHLIKRNFKVKEIPVEMAERKKGKSMFHSPIKSIYYMIIEMILILFVS